MLGGSVSGLLGSSGDNAAEAASAHHEGGGGGVGDGVIVTNSASSLFGDELQDKGDRSSAGNRWPRQETLALLKIRSDMDGVFRDSSLKGPLWDDVSRKMAELGFHRSAKKCKEKFENVYKYHKRTKDGRATKQDGKNYRFFDQLEALDHHHPSLLPSLAPQSQPKAQAPPVAAASATMATMPLGTAHPPPTTVSHVTVPSTTNPTIANMSLNTTTITQQPPITNHTISFQPAATIPNSTIPSSLPNMHANLMSNYTSSSSTSSDEEFQGRNKKKRKWKEFFERLMNEVIEKQEKLQKKFLEAIEKREHDRMIREESWKMQEMARMNREHEILVQERSMAAAKDAAVIAFLQKISEQQTPVPQPQQTPVTQAQVVLKENVSVMSRQPQPQSQPQPQPPPPPPQQQQQQQLALPLPPPPQAKAIKDIPKLDNGGGGSIASPSRWPKAEVQALINLRTSLDLKYQENGPKGPLWEDISSGMAKIGYNRSAKRCKEKWENINKYFKKVKESNKRRPEDSKTCPYFHLLDALYKEKNKFDPSNSLTAPSYGLVVKPDDQNPMAPLMVQPEQQWPLQQADQQQQRHEGVAMEEDVDESENMGQNHGEEEEEDGDDDDVGDEDDDEDEDDEGGGGYEIVSNKPANYTNTVGNVE